MRVAVVGATGLVGGKMLEVLNERNFPVEQLIPVASERSIGKSIVWKGQSIPVVTLQQALEIPLDIALFSAGGSTSLEWAPKFAEKGIFVIDNSSAWRMDESVPLVVPEVNAHALISNHKIIANPNCSTIQMVVALKPLHDEFELERVIVSTYQSVTGTGQKAVDQMNNERAGIDGTMVYPYKIDLNVLPHIDVFQENGYTKEEMKMILETRKIMELPNLKITATTVRVPTIGGHSESINASFRKHISVSGVKNCLSKAPGIIITDNPEKLEYPMPITAHNRDEVFIGRIRIDESADNSINLWVVADNLRKGAATNAVQIAEIILNKGFIS